MRPTTPFWIRPAATTGWATPADLDYQFSEDDLPKGADLLLRAQTRVYGPAFVGNTGLVYRAAYDLPQEVKRDSLHDWIERQYTGWDKKVKHEAKHKLGVDVFRPVHIQLYDAAPDYYLVDSVTLPPLGEFVGVDSEERMVFLDKRMLPLGKLRVHRMRMVFIILYQDKLRDIME